MQTYCNSSHYHLNYHTHTHTHIYIYIYMSYKISSFIKIDILKVVSYLVTVLTLRCHEVGHMIKVVGTQGFCGGMTS